MEVPDTVGEGVIELELAFERSDLSCLRWVCRDVQSQEQTLEIRLPDGMPEIGTVLGAWGQCILRSKEWRSDEAGVSGGVMAWVLYQPADGSEPRCLEGWLPMQLKWRLRDCEKEGIIRTKWNLKNVDARTLSGRKMMVRAVAEVLAEILEPIQTQCYAPVELPEDIQLLKRSYPAVIPREAGEKTFRLEEELSLPSPAESIIYSQLIPQVTEQKVTGDKAIFRGNLKCHLLYRGADGILHSTDQETGFAQFEDLENSYEENADICVMMDVTGFEPELVDGKLLLKGGMTAQYLVLDRTMLEQVEDAYSPIREVTLQKTPVEVPVVLDSCHKTLEPELGPVEGKVVDLWASAGHPTVRRAGELTEMEFPGTVQVLSYDDNGGLCVNVQHWNERWELPANSGVQIHGSIGPVTATLAGSRIGMELQARADSVTAGAADVVSGLETGVSTPPDPERPSLILRRAGNGTLWDLAKSCGSTVEEIRSANGLTQEPLDDRILLIPIP